MTRAAMWLLLAVVSSAAAVLSFAALRDLAVLCGFSAWLAWLLPVVVDAGAAAGCLVWLRWGGSGHLVTSTSQRFARALTWTLLASSVCGNAVVHYLTAYQLRPAWWLVVIASAIAPAVLGAVVHLAVLVGRTSGGEITQLTSPAQDCPGRLHTTGEKVVDGASAVNGAAALGEAEVKTEQLIEQGAGRRRLSRELNISEHAARQLLAERNGAGQ